MAHTLKFPVPGFKSLFCLLGFLLHSASGWAQTDHWEAAIHNSDNRRYFPGVSAPDPNWREVAFNDLAWSQGPGGIGLGDGDDSTIIAPEASVYMRIPFNLTDTLLLEDFVLNLDYDDGFIAYLNGYEVARANFGLVVGDDPVFTALANGTHEAKMYSGGFPEPFLIQREDLRGIIRNGPNVLALRVANEAVNSTDISSNLWLSMGISDTLNHYRPNPAWFFPPLVSSNLPIVSINTYGAAIPDEPRIEAFMGIINNGTGQRNNVADPFNEYSGLITIEVRGCITQQLPKKSYSFSTKTTLGSNRNVSIFGMGAENDWILYGPYTDETLMRNYVIYDRFEKMGNYAVKRKYVEVLLNNQYEGVYIFMEKIKADKSRLDLPGLSPADTNGDAITGGYVFEDDWIACSGIPAWQSPYQIVNTAFYFYDPDIGDLNQAQKDYLRAAVSDLETDLFGPGFAHPDSGYRRHIDTRSFIDYMVIQELTHNHDGYRSSQYFHKGRNSEGGKIRMGPVWDFNMALGNSNFCRAADTTGWEYDTLLACPGLRWWPRFTADTHFLNAFYCRWNELREGVLHPDTLNSFIDNTVAWLDESQKRNFQRWKTLGVYTPWNPWTAMTYQEGVDFMKNWLSSRGRWVDNHSPSGLCIPQGQELLSITEINYHSDTIVDAGDWIELHNRNQDTLDLSWWMFRDGNAVHSYSFPFGTVIPPDSYLVLCLDTARFRIAYPDLDHVRLLGNFGFNLGNGGDALHFYNENYVELLSMNYRDKAPWPESPDGGGYTLELINPLGNPGDPASWTAGCIYGSPGGPRITPCFPVSTTSAESAPGFSIYPNPFDYECHLDLDPEIPAWYGSLDLQLINMTGQSVLQIRDIEDSGIIRRGNLPSGVYFAKLMAGNRLIGTRKLVIH